MKNRRNRPHRGSQPQPNTNNVKSIKDNGDAWDTLVTQTMEQLEHTCFALPTTIAPNYEPLFKKAQRILERRQQLRDSHDMNGDGTVSAIAVKFPAAICTSDLERTACNLTQDATLLKSLSVRTADCLFYIAINLGHTDEDTEDSIQRNCEQIIKALAEAVIQGAPVYNLERFLQLSIHLKNATGQYPIRPLVTKICMTLLEHKAISSRTASWLLRFILGPADYILYHLESRLAILPKAQALREERKTFDDMETKALVERLARLLKLQPLSTVVEQIRYRAYTYIERLIQDPIRGSKLDLILKEMPVVRWKLSLEKDPLLWLFMDQYPDVYTHFWASMSLHQFDYSPLEPRLGELLNVLNMESKGIPELLSTLLEQQLERRWEEKGRGSRTGHSDLHSSDACEQWEVDRRLQDGLLTSANRLVSQLQRHDNGSTPTKDVTYLLDIHVLVQRMAPLVVVTPLCMLLRIMYILTLCAHMASLVLDSLDNDEASQKLVIQIQAICMDAWHHCLVRRYEPRRHQGHQTHQQSNSSDRHQGLTDLRRSIIFAIVFVPDLLTSFAYNTTLMSVKDNSTSAPDLFVRETFQALVPTLELALDWEMSSMQPAAPKASNGGSEESTGQQVDHEKDSFFTCWLASRLIRQWTNDDGQWNNTEMQAIAERFHTFVLQLQLHSSFSRSSLWQYLNLTS